MLTWSGTVSVSHSNRLSFSYPRQLNETIMLMKQTITFQAGADLGGAGSDAPFPQGFDPLLTQRVPPLVLLGNPVLANQP